MRSSAAGSHGNRDSTRVLMPPPHGFCRGSAIALDDQHANAGAREATRRGGAGRTGARDDDVCVVFRAHARLTDVRGRTGHRCSESHARASRARRGRRETPRRSRTRNPFRRSRPSSNSAPALIVLERLFAATPRGAALINRIKSDPQLADVRSARDVAHRRLLAAGRQAVDGRSRRRRRRSPSGGQRRPASRSPPRTRRGRSTGTARAARRGTACATGVEMQLDGNPATVDRSLRRRRAGDLAHRPAPEPEGPHQHPGRRVRDALPRRDRLGEVRAAQAPADARRNTGPASSSPTADAAAIEGSATATSSEQADSSAA